MKTFAPINYVEAAKVRRKRFQAFYTPEIIVDVMVSTASGWEGCLALEPGAGDGRIVHKMTQAGFKVEACELDPEMYDICSSNGANMVGRDFLKYEPGERYNLIVMNPPFARNQHIKHIEHAYRLLRPGGEIVAVAPDSTRLSVGNYELDLPECDFVVYESLDADLFKESGAAVKTILLTIRKPNGGRVEIEGFKNWATWNAALTISTHEKMARRAMIEPCSNLRQELSDCGGSQYGVDWAEVENYLRDVQAEDGPL